MRRTRVSSHHSTIAAARSCAAALVLFLLSCRDAAAPPGPPYLAIVADLYALEGATTPSRLTYRVRGAGEPTLVDRRISVAPTDTVILSVPPATYSVEVEGLPTRCIVQHGAVRGIALSDADNTGLVRYSIQCRGLLNVAVITDGYDVDPGYVYRVRDSRGTELTGLVAANDTVTINEASSGDFEVQIGGIAPNCVVLSDGGSFQWVTVTETGGATASFRLRCSELAHRPQLLSLVSSYTLGASVFTFTVWDPDGDLDGYTWDITDCRGTSVLPDRRERVRRSIASGRGQLTDTLVVVGAYEVGVAAADLVGKCTEIRAFDLRSNSSVILSHRIGSAVGHPPAVRFFNARLEGTAQVVTQLFASDPENDIVGHFVLVRLRDGVLSAPDGVPDLGSMDPAGYLGLDVPAIPTNGRIRWDDVLAVIVYVIDAQGNAVRVIDADIFR